jgi:dTDP-4-dehydrorhamnose 3,5-epimerase
MQLKATSLKDCYIIKPKVIGDSRGYFLESYNKNKFDELIGKKVDFIQDNEAKSSKGVLRGLHFQLPPFSQAKLVRVTRGKVLDVVVDLRKSSPTYLKHQSIVLSSKNKKQLFVPRGFAHGYKVLSKTAVFYYKVDNHYSPESDSGILWKDEDLNIDWKIDDEELIISEKDKNQQTLKAFQSPF